MSPKNYSVTSPIRHNGKEYGIGESIDLNDQDAAGLLAVNAIEPAAAASAPAAPADPAERIAAIVEAIGKLNVDNGELWAKNGIPKTDAIAGITGWVVTAAERDAAWAQINATK